MAESRLKIDIRRGAILQQLRAEGRLTVSGLSQTLGVTPVTIRNDLGALEKEGYLRRIPGGAVSAQRPEGFLHPEEEVRFAQEKQEIARIAAKRIPDGSTLFLSSGTTSLMFAKELRTHRALNVVTNSLAIAGTLQGAGNAHVVLLGGEVNPEFGYTCGEAALTQLGGYQARFAVLSVDGITAAEGATSCHSDEASLNRMMIERAASVMIIADHTKVGQAGFANLCPASPSMTLVTAGACDDSAIEALQGHGVTVIRNS